MIFLQRRFLSAQLKPLGPLKGRLSDYSLRTMAYNLQVPLWQIFRVGGKEACRDICIQSSFQTARMSPLVHLLSRFCRHGITGGFPVWFVEGDSAVVIRLWFPLMIRTRQWRVVTVPFVSQCVKIITSAHFRSASVCRCHNLHMVVAEFQFFLLFLNLSAISSALSLRKTFCTGPSDGGLSLTPPPISV